MKTLKLGSRAPRLLATGGGALAHGEELQELFTTVTIVDEMESLITGLNYLVATTPFEAFHYARGAPGPGSPSDAPRLPVASPSELEFLPIPHARQMFPYLLCNIGSGVSIIKVTAPGEFERVGGSSFGGGTFWGLVSLFYDDDVTFDQILDDALTGASDNIDLLVREIYGAAYSDVGLAGDTIAASFGKAMRVRAAGGKVDRADVANSLLKLLCLNISQISVLTAKLHNVRQLYYGGYFIRRHPVTMFALEFGTDYWSHGRLRATFLAHEGFLGAVGTLVSPKSALHHRLPPAARSPTASSAGVSPDVDAAALADALSAAAERRAAQAESSPEDSLEAVRAPGFARRMTAREAITEYVARPAHGLVRLAIKGIAHFVPGVRPPQPWRAPGYRRPWHGSQLDQAFTELRQPPVRRLEETLSGDDALVGPGPRMRGAAAAACTNVEAIQLAATTDRVLPHLNCLCAQCKPVN